MAIKPERTISLGERLCHELCESVVYPGAEEKRLANQTWWNTPYTRWDAEASPEENAANGALDPASRKVGQTTLWSRSIHEMSDSGPVGSRDSSRRPINPLSR